MTSFGKRLNDLRERYDMTQEQVARRMGGDTVGNTIARWEKLRDGRYPETEKVIALAECFHVSTDFLLCLTDVEAPYAASPSGAAARARYAEEREKAKAAKRAQAAEAGVDVLAAPRKQGKRRATRRKPQ